MSDKFGVPTDEQLAKINKLAKRNLSKDEVFVFPSKLAGDMIIPNRYIQLQKELLDVYASDAKKGVSLLLDHSWSPDGFFGLGGRPKAAIPYGRTFDSRYETSTEEGETISLVADHYMLKGVEIDGIKTDDLAVSIEAGTLFDTSIGFGFNKSTCSVCDKDYRRCDHYAGRTYEIEGEDGVTRNKLCYIKAEPPGYLMENSLVFDGAYPGAGVLSNIGDIAENENGIFEVISDIKGIDPEKPILSVYSNNRGITTLVKKADHKKIYATGGIVSKPKIYAGGTIIEPDTVAVTGEEHIIDLPQFRDLAKHIAKGKNKQKADNSLIETTIDELGLGMYWKGSENNMDERQDMLTEMLNKFGVELKEGTNDPNELLLELAEKWAEYFKAGETDADTTEYLGIPLSEITEKFGEGFTGDDLMRLAKEGQEYHKALSDEAIAMGVRAMGNNFPKETWEKSFTTMDTKAIKDIMATWELQAKSTIPDGRLSDPSIKQKQGNATPDDAYKV